mgnify:CR=1 FL=1
MTALLTHRAHCRLLFLKRVSERGIDLKPEEIADLEALCEALRPAYERPDAVRYILTIRRGRLGWRRLTVVYDTRLHCLVTVVPVHAMEDSCR